MTPHPSSSASRWVASALLLVAAGAHIPLVSEHLHEAPYVGVLFVALSVVYVVVLAGVMLLAESEAAGRWPLAGATSLAAILAYLASRTVGLPQIRDDVGHWTEPLSLPALISRALLVVLAGVHLTQSHQRPLSPSSPDLRKAAP